MRIDLSCLNGESPSFGLLKEGQPRAKVIDSFWRKPAMIIYYCIYKTVAHYATTYYAVAHASVKMYKSIDLYINKLSFFPHVGNQRGSIKVLSSKAEKTSPLMVKNSVNPQPSSLNKPFFDISLKSGIYTITCVPLSKHYIGESSHVRARLNNHKTTLRSGSHACRQLQLDFNKYGEENFVFKRLLYGTGQPLDKRLELETIILETLLLSHQRYNAYTNSRRRKAENNPFYGRTHTAEARESQSFANKGKTSNFAGHTQSNKVKKMLSQHNSGSSSKERRKPLYIDQDYYESVTEAHEITGLARRLIRERCHSTEDKWKKYRWADNEGVNTNENNQAS